MSPEKQSPPLADGLKDKLVRSSATLLALTGLSTLAVVGTVQYTTAQRGNEALATKIREAMTAHGTSLTSSHAEVFSSFVRDTALTQMQGTVANSVLNHDVVYGLYTDHTGRPWAYCSPTFACNSDSENSQLAVVDEEQVRTELRLESAPDSADVASRRTHLFGQEIREFQHPVTVDGERAGTLRYGISTQKLDQALARMRSNQRSLLVTSLLTIFAVVCGALFIGIAIARSTAHRITQPLFQLIRATQSLAQGKRPEPVVIDSGDEIEVLGSAFNSMANELNASYTQLETKNVELEREVESRRLVQAERTELRDHLIQSQKMEAFGQLAGGVAHDFNNILAVIVGSSEISEEILAERGEEQELLELNESISTAAERGANLTRQLLTFARKEADNPRLVDVNESLSNFEKMIRRVLEETVDVEVHASTTPLTILIDPGRLEQVLMNLCVNARDAMPSGGSLQLSASRIELTDTTSLTSDILPPGPYVVLETRDSGSGISKEVLEHVFEPFFTTKAAGQGTGLGLAMVHGIVRAAEGAVHVESQAGEGTAFQIFLPAQTGDSSTRPAPHSSRAPSGQGRLIVLCEDDRAVRAMTETVLKRAGYDVISVASGANALARLSEDSADLLITDAVMPEMDGGEVAQRAQRAHPQLPVLFVSGYTGGVLSNCGVSEDSLNFLRKPFRARDLLERVNAMIERGSLD